MFRKNKKHLQPPLISNVNQLPERQRQRLEQSWAGVFYREVFSRLDETPFGVMYADIPSRPNVAVNVLVGLEFLKSGFGWSDEELYEKAKDVDAVIISTADFQHARHAAHAPSVTPNWITGRTNTARMPIKAVPAMTASNTPAEATSKLRPSKRQRSLASNCSVPRPARAATASVYTLNNRAGPWNNAIPDTAL